MCEHPQSTDLFFFLNIRRSVLHDEYKLLARFFFTAMIVIRKVSMLE